MAISQRPLNLGEILDRTIQIYRGHFLLFAGIGVVPAAISVGVSSLSGLFSSPQSKPSLEGALTAMGFALVYLFVGVPASLAASAMLRSASNFAVMHISYGEPANVRGAYSFAFGHFLRHLWLYCRELLFAFGLPFVLYLGAAFIAGIVGALAGRGAVAVVLIVAAIPAVAVGGWLYVRYTLAFAVSVVEDRPAKIAMQRSIFLTQGARGKIFVLWLLGVVVTFIVQFCLRIPLDFLFKLNTRWMLAPGAHPMVAGVAERLTSYGINFAVQLLVQPIFPIALMLFYFDQRTREEGYDIELLMVRAGWTGQTAIAGEAAAMSAVREEVSEVRMSPAAEVEAEGMVLEEKAAEGRFGDSTAAEGSGA